MTQLAKRNHRRRVRARLSISNLVAPLVGILVAIAVWWVLTGLYLKNSRIFPTPPMVWEELVRILGGTGPLGSTYSHMAATAGRVAAAFVLAYVIGTAIGIAAGRNRWVFDFVSNLAWVAFAVPSVVWAFIFVAILGITNAVPITAVTVLLLAPIISGTAEGIKALDKDLTSMADAYHASRWQKIRHLYVPGALPMLMANARIALALDLKIVIVAEVVGLPHGVGLLVRYWSQKVNLAPEAAWAVIFIVVGLLVDRGILAPIERRIKHSQ